MNERRKRIPPDAGTTDDGRPNMVSVTFRMPEELRDAIDAKARAQGQTRGEMGREVWAREVGL